MFLPPDFAQSRKSIIKNLLKYMMNEWDQLAVSVMAFYLDLNRLTLLEYELNFLINNYVNCKIYICHTPLINFKL